MENSIMEDLHKAMDAYIKRQPNPKRAMKQMQQRLEAEPDIREVSQLLPMDEMETRLDYVQKIEKGQRAFHENPSWGFTPYQYATLMNLPLKTLENYSQADEEIMSINFEPMGKFLAHFFKRGQSEEGRKATQKLAKHYDGDSCVVTGLADPQGCHIVPFTWNSTEEHLQTAITVSGVLRHFFWHDDSPGSSYVLGVLSTGLRDLDKTWNMICLSPQLQTWWSHAYFGLKYLGHEDDKETGMSTAELQFVWMPHSHYGKSTKRIDLNEEKDKETNIRVCLEHTFGGEPPCSPHCDRCAAIFKVQAHKVPEHYTIESGYVFPVVRRTEDIGKFKVMIQIQWAVICVGSMSGAANYPELLVDDDDDDDNDENQPSLVASVSNRIEGWLESVHGEDSQRASQP